MPFFSNLIELFKNRHLVGLFSRSIQFLENGIKPVWVFDGKPPKRKNGEVRKNIYYNSLRAHLPTTRQKRNKLKTLSFYFKLARRKKIKEEAQEKMEDAAETGDMEEALKQKIRTTSVTYKMKDDAKRMLSLMGMPVIEVNN
jgi:flap endonuclease-1